MSPPSFRPARMIGLLLAGLLFASAWPAADARAQAAYWPLLCRGPLPQVSVDKELMTLTAIAGRRAGRPRAGECVWLDRHVRRRGEMMPDGRMVIRLRIDGWARLVSRNGRVRTGIANDPEARRIWRRNQRGQTFRIGARRVGRGIYEAQYTPTAWPDDIHDDMPPHAGPPGWHRPAAVRIVIDRVVVHKDGDRRTPGDWFMTLSAGRVGAPDADGRRWPARGTVDVFDGRSYRPGLRAEVRGLRRGDRIRVQVTATDCDGNGLLDLGALLPGEAGDAFREMRQMMQGDGCTGEEPGELSRNHDSAGITFVIPPRAWRRGATFSQRVRDGKLDFTISGRVVPLR